MVTERREEHETGGRLAGFFHREKTERTSCERVKNNGDLTAEGQSKKSGGAIWPAREGGRKSTL